MYSILIAGAGYIGRAAGRYFISKKQKVWGLVRSETRAAELEKEGFLPVARDLNDTGAGAAKIPPAHFIVISVAPDDRSEAGYRKTYLDAVGNLLAAVKNNPKPFLVLYLSSTGVYGEGGQGEWTDESAVPAPQTERGRILLEAEQRVLASGLPAAVFRLSGIYGPERNRLADFQAGVWPPAEADAYMNMIHAADIVQAIPALFNKAEQGKVYLGVDDAPALRSEVAAWLAARLNRAAPAAPPAGPTGRRYSNRALRSLGFQFSYPTFREGYSSFLKS